MSKSWWFCASQFWGRFLLPLYTSNQTRHSLHNLNTYHYELGTVKADRPWNVSTSLFKKDYK
eukprot:322119-Hanusia_phi.AAC.3